jgi:glycerol kinase
MIKPYTLAIDQGGQSTRVAVFDALGAQVCCFAASCATTQYSPDHSSLVFIEQDASDIVRGIEICLAQIVTYLGDEINAVTSAGFAGQGSSFLCWNHQTGDPITPVLSWQDTRGESLLPYSQLSHQHAQAISGLRVSPHYGASKIRWCLIHDDHVISAQKNNVLSVGPIVSFVFTRLLHNKPNKNMVDPGHAQRTLLWNMRSNNWDNFLVDIFTIDKQLLPECAFHNSYFGDLWVGAHKVPVVASARDQGASVFARGLPDANAVYINIGTGAFIQRVCERMTAPEGLLVAPLYLSKNQTDQTLYAWEATVNGAASAISYIAQQAGIEITPENINQSLLLNPHHECYFLNAVGGLSAPYWRTDLASQFSENLSPYEKILAWLESILFQITVNIFLMQDLGAANKIYISGGLSNTDLLCQTLADLTQLPVYRYENADATLQGIAYLAAAMPKEWNQIQSVRIFTPLTNHFLYKRFSSWQTAMNKWLARN